MCWALGRHRLCRLAPGWECVTHWHRSHAPARIGWSGLRRRRLRRLLHIPPTKYPPSGRCFFMANLPRGQEI
jgi:hypothetical protein